MKKIDPKKQKGLAALKGESSASSCENGLYEKRWQS